VEFVISQGRPCADPTYADYSSVSYPLDSFSGINGNCGDQLGGSFFDSRYQQLDTMNNALLLQNNGLYPLFANLPLINVASLSVPTSLWARSYIGLDGGSCYPKARGNITDIDGFSQLQVNSKFLIIGNIEDTLKAVFAMAILTGCVVVVVYFITKTLINCYVINSYFAAVTVDIITSLVLLGFFIAATVAAAKINDFRAWYKHFILNKFCSDLITNDILIDMSRLLSNLLAFNIVIACLAPILAILVFLDLFMFNKGGYATERVGGVGQIGQVDQFRAIDTQPDVVRKI